MDGDDDLLLKIILIGSSGVGKSNITLRFCDNVFYEDVAPTIGMDFKYTHCETLEKKPRSVRLQVWDSAGQDTFVTLTTAFYRNCHGIILCFDLTNRQSFEDLDKWYGLVEKNCGVVPPLLLVGCKLDLVTSSQTDSDSSGIRLGSLRQISKSEGDGWARQHNCLCYIETSAKENTNVTSAFQQLTTFIANSSHSGAGRSHAPAFSKQSSKKTVDMKGDGKGKQEDSGKGCC